MFPVERRRRRRRRRGSGATANTLESSQSALGAEEESPRVFGSALVVRRVGTRLEASRRTYAELFPAQRPGGHPFRLPASGPATERPGDTDGEAFTLSSPVAPWGISRPFRSRETHVTFAGRKPTPLTIDVSGLVPRILGKPPACDLEAPAGEIRVLVGPREAALSVSPAVALSAPMPVLLHRLQAGVNVGGFPTVTTDPEETER
jgi:hypothetical protein